MSNQTIELTEEQIEQIKEALRTEERCPHCGYCPHCGRSNPIVVRPVPYVPWVPVSPYPYVPATPYPYNPWGPITITSVTSATAAAPKTYTTLTTSP